MRAEEEAEGKTSHPTVAFNSVLLNPSEDIPNVGNSTRDEVTRKVVIGTKAGTGNNGRARKIVAFSKNEDLPRSILNAKITYDEYEEDKSLVQASRMRKPSRFSLLLREWISTQLKSTEVGRMTKKARKVLEKERAASAAAEAEKIRAQMIRDMHEEIRLERQNAERQASLEKREAAMRDVQLAETHRVLGGHKNAFAEYVTFAEKEENWIRYMTCDGLPDPGSLSEMNTFVFLWSVGDEKINMENVATKYDVIIYLLTKLDEIIRFSLTRSPDYISECEIVRQRFRDKLREWIDAACYALLRQVERDMMREDTRSARYSRVSGQISCCIWALIKWPIGLKQITEKDRKPIEVHFEEIELTVKMPTDVDCYCMAIRALWVKYDHYSNCAASYAMPQLQDKYESVYTTVAARKLGKKGNERPLRLASSSTGQLADFHNLCRIILHYFLAHCQDEYNAKLKIREEQVEGRRLRLEEKKVILERMENPPVPVAVKLEKKGKQQKKPGAQTVRAKRPELEQEPEQLPYLPTPDEIILQREEEVRKEIRKLLFTRCEKTEINLRKYRILGGVLHIDLIYQPPQPKDMKRDITLTTLQIPKELKFVPFAKPYKAPPPAPDSERTPEVIEAEMKALETAMEALVLVTLKLPSSIVWFEPPLVAHWIPERRIWSTQDVHDIKYNEEKQTIAFRTGRLGVHGLAAFKFINIPFQSWELKPEMGRNARGGVALSVSAAIVQAEFIVREDSVCLNSLVGGISTTLKEIIGEYMKLHFLIEKMRDAGCDLFPERDAFSYVKALPVKHPATEKHLRECMALLSTAYTFSWSRWNANRSSREIVIQFKELHGCVAKERTNITLLITPLRTTAVSCIEVSSEFSDVSLDGENSKFYADLYHLALQNAGIKSRLLMKNVSFKLAKTVAELLGCTNVINMSS